MYPMDTHGSVNGYYVGYVLDQLLLYSGRSVYIVILKLWIGGEELTSSR